MLITAQCEYIIHKDHFSCENNISMAIFQNQKQKFGEKQKTNEFEIIRMKRDWAHATQHTLKEWEVR